MNDLLLKEGLTCIIYKDGIIYKSKERGVKPLLSLIEQGISLDGFSSVDKVVGKAAAFLYLILGVSNIHAHIISEHAYNLLILNNINVTFDKMVSFIENRTKNGRCPMESAVLNINNKSDALIAIKNKLLEMRG